MKCVYNCAHCEFKHNISPFSSVYILITNQSVIRYNNIRLPIQISHCYKHIKCLYQYTALGLLYTHNAHALCDLLNVSNRVRTRWDNIHLMHVLDLLHVSNRVRQRVKAHISLVLII